MSGGRSCSRTARRRLGAARREPRGAGGHGTPCLAACAPGRLPARDGTSSMSSGYSSLEEDAEDFFFTARTSFFRRAPQGKPRSGQQVSGARGWSPTPRVSAGRGCSQGKRRGPPRRGFSLFGCRGRALLELVHVGVRACVGGAPGEERRKGGEAEAGPCLPCQMASAAPPRAAAAGGLFSARRRPRAAPGVSPASQDSLRPTASPSAPPGATAASSLGPFLLVSSVACGPSNGLRGRVIARRGRGDLASSTFGVQAPHLCVGGDR